MITMHPSSLWKSEETKAEVGLIPITLRAFQCSGDSIKRCNYLFHKAPHLLFVFPLHPYLHQLLPPAIAGGFMCVYTSVISAQRGHNKQNTSPWVHFSEWALLRIVAPVVHKEGGNNESISTEASSLSNVELLFVTCWRISAVCIWIHPFYMTVSLNGNPDPDPIVPEIIIYENVSKWSLVNLSVSMCLFVPNQVHLIVCIPCFNLMNACLWDLIIKIINSPKSLNKETRSAVKYANNYL